MQGLPFQQVKHRVDTLDAQPGYEPGKEDGSIICLVTGALLVWILGFQGGGHWY